MIVGIDAWSASGLADKPKTAACCEFVQIAGLLLLLLLLLAGLLHCWRRPSI